MRSLNAACLAALAGIALSFLASVASAQTVPPPSAPAYCVQNGSNLDFACGAGAVAQPGSGSTAIGIDAKANGDAATAVGANANASSISAIAVGQNSIASSTGAVALGQGANATGTSAIGIGFAGRGLAAGTVAIGDTATAQGSNSIAIGNGASTALAASTALGAGAQATVANQMKFGTATNILAAPGLVSAASKAAQKGQVLMVTVDADGNLATAAVPACMCRPVPPIKTPVRTKR